jgi:hypothetical protein
MPAPIFAVFAKPWKSLPIPQLARHIHRLGFTHIELPVRPGFPCEPDAIETCLPLAIRQLADEGVSVLNVTVALPLDAEKMYAACAKAGIHMNRVMFDRAPGEIIGRRKNVPVWPWIRLFHSASATGFKSAFRIITEITCLAMRWGCTICSKITIQD